jgi:hypothetical protein
MRKAYKKLKKRLLGRDKCRWKDSNKIDLKKILLENVDWIHLAQNRDQWQSLVDTVMKYQVS